MKKMVIFYIFIAVLLFTGHAIYLDVTPSSYVTDGVTENVTLTCALNSSSADIGTQTAVIRVHKLVNNNWVPLAEIVENHNRNFNIQDMLVRGDFRQKDDAVLLLIWPLASNETLGSYNCELIAFGFGQETVLESAGPLRIAKAQGDTVLQELQQCQRDLVTQKDLVTSLSATSCSGQSADNSTLNSLLLIRVLESLNHLDTRLNKVSSDMFYNNVRTDLALADIKTDLAKMMTDQTAAKPSSSCDTNTDTTSGSGVPDDLDDWPEGTYAMLMPDTGCPNDTDSITWETGIRKFHTESMNATNNDAVSSPSHLSLPIKTIENGEHFMTQHFCVIKERTSPTKWPAGSYCLQQLRYRCPDSFQVGEITVDEEDLHYAGTASKDFMHTVYDHRMYYCCRSDGPANVTISLPTSTPFYLYRFKGQCQQVQGMTVTPEFMILDTESPSNADRYTNDIHPDGTIDDITLELCYYTSN